jgi:hypothetical protein
MLRSVDHVLLVVRRAPHPTLSRWERALRRTGRNRAESLKSLSSSADPHWSPPLSSLIPNPANLAALSHS